MTLEEAIKHAEEVAEQNERDVSIKDKDRAKACYQCAEEHRQLAEWLKDYQRMQSVIEDIKAEITESQKVVSETLKFDKEDCFYNGKWAGFELALAIIDKHIEGWQE